jgi:8-oxo-dGTP pyrophosphatase MutT (NUDIX family)
VHSDGMSADARNVRSVRWAIDRSPLPAREVAGEFVRLSHLRKIRECEQVAAVCYRVRGSGIEFLLVRTRGSGRWTFPKGSAEPGLTHAQAAALEAFEEAGVHGRIEEAAFARYIRRKRGSMGNTTSRSGEKRVAVNAHLCEVSRLSTPQEPKRNRTWFSVEDARRSLREGRKSEDRAEFARVVDQAVARIQQLYGATGIVDHPRRERAQQTRPRPDSLQKDGLQKVQFDFAEAYGRVQDVSRLPYIRRQNGAMRRFASSAVEAERHEVLPCEVLEFSPLREKKAKALGSGTKNC